MDETTLESSTAIGLPRNQELVEVTRVVEPLIPRASANREEVEKLLEKAELSVGEAQRVRDLCGDVKGRLRKALEAMIRYEDIDLVEQYFAVIDQLRGDPVHRFSGELFMQLSAAFTDVYVQDPNNSEDVEQAMAQVCDQYEFSGYRGNIGGFAKKMLDVHRAFPDEVLSLEDAVALYEKSKSWTVARKAVEEDEEN